jgi:putative transposase
MPRRLLRGTGGMVFHVMNRGVRRSQLFFSPADYEALMTILCEAAERVAMRVLAIVLMPNHWHLVLWPRDDGDLTAYVGWVSLTHACRWQRAHETRGLGPVYQGRFKAIPIQTDRHLLTVLRYVERNPVRPGLVSLAQDWPYSSASDILIPDRPRLAAWPIPRPSNWLELVNTPDQDAALTALRKCVAHSTPFGTGEWCDETATRLGWTTGLRPAGRPFALAQTLPE